MIREVKYNQDYICKAEYADSIYIEFTKEEQNTYMNITTIQFASANTYTKRYLITKEDEIDEEDLRNINNILHEQEISLVTVEEEEENLWI